jgi:hypothetical protein
MLTYGISLPSILKYGISLLSHGETSMPPYNFVAGGIINWKSWGLTAV